MGSYNCTWTLHLHIVAHQLTFLVGCSFSSPFILRVMNPSNVLMLPRCVFGGISNSNSGIVNEQELALTIIQFKSYHRYTCSTDQSLSSHGNYFPFNKFSPSLYNHIVYTYMYLYTMYHSLWSKLLKTNYYYYYYNTCIPKSNTSNVLTCRVYLTPSSGIVDPSMISLLLWPQWGQLNEAIMTSLNRGIFVNKRRVSPWV